MIFPPRDYRRTKLVGLLPFAWIAWSEADFEKRAMGTAIAVNGVLCHWHGKNAFVLWDVFANLLLILYANTHTEWQPQSALLTALSFSSFAWSYPHPSSLFHCAAHVLLVQGSMAVALAHYQNRFRS